jgi:hypothetical protein
MHYRAWLLKRWPAAGPLAVVVVGLLLATACSSSGDDTSEVSAPASEEPATEGDAGTDEAPTDSDDDGTAPADEPAAVAADATVVRVGYAFPDLAAFAVLNEDFGIGDPQLQAEAVVDRWRREGLLPEGLDVELVFAAYNILDTSAKLGVCTSMAEDEAVFAVVSGLQFTVGAECLATRFGLPVIDTEGAPPSLYQRGAPWLFTLRPDHARYYTAYGQWAIEQDVMQGRRVGLFFETKIDEGVEAMRELFDQEGIDVVSVTEVSGEGIGSTEDQTVVQRFIDDEVDVVLPLVGGSSAVNMYSFAEGQGYRPIYLDMDYSEHTTDVAAKTNPAEQYDGTVAMTVTRIGEQAGGVDNPSAEACLANYERYAGVDISREPPESGEFSSILRTCDLFMILLAGLHGAADDLTPESFVAALETAGEIELVGSANGSFSAEDHSLVDQYRTIQWDAACPCWRAQTDFVPMASG